MPASGEGVGPGPKREVFNEMLRIITQVDDRAYEYWRLGLGDRYSLHLSHIHSPGRQSRLKRDGYVVALSLIALQVPPTINPFLLLTAFEGVDSLRDLQFVEDLLIGDQNTLKRLKLWPLSHNSEISPDAVEEIQYMASNCMPNELVNFHHPFLSLRWLRWFPNVVVVYIQA